METKKIEILQQPNLRATMEGMEIGQYFDADVRHMNTLQQYASMYGLGGRNFKITRIETGLRVTRIKK